MFGQHRPTGCPLRQGTNPLKIVIWTGPAWETWGPGSLHTGLGGSETAAIHMASELALWGHDVEIIGQVTPCEYNGVKFKNHLLCMNSPIECDVWISSRDPSVFRMLKPKAKLSVLWCHDIHMGDDYQGLVRQHDIVLCLSNWHRKILSTYYSDVPKEKFVVTRNGIDPKLFLREPKKNECKILFSRSRPRPPALLLAQDSRNAARHRTTCLLRLQHMATNGRSERQQNSTASDQLFQRAPGRHAGLWCLLSWPCRTSRTGRSIPRIVHVALPHRLFGNCMHFRHGSTSSGMSGNHHETCGTG